MVGKSSTGLWLGLRWKAGCVHLCRAEGNTVWSHNGKWHQVALRQSFIKSSTLLNLTLERLKWTKDLTLQKSIIINIIRMIKLLAHSVLFLLNKLQLGIILLISKIWKIRNIRFIGNLILSITCEFHHGDITVTSLTNIIYRDITVLLFVFSGKKVLEPMPFSLGCIQCMVTSVLGDQQYMFGVGSLLMVRKCCWWGMT